MLALLPAVIWTGCGDAPTEPRTVGPIEVAQARTAVDDARQRILPALSMPARELIDERLSAVDMAAEAGDADRFRARVDELRQSVLELIAAHPASAPDLGALLLVADLFDRTHTTR